MQLVKVRKIPQISMLHLKKTGFYRKVLYPDNLLSIFTFKSVPQMIKIYLFKGIAMLMLLFFSISLKAQVEFKPVPKPDTVKMKKSKPHSETLKTSIPCVFSRKKTKKDSIDRVFRKKRAFLENVYKNENDAFPVIMRDHLQKSKSIVQVWYS